MHTKKRHVRKLSQRRKLVIACIACAAVLVGLLATAGIMAYQDANRVYPLVRAEAGLAHLDPDVFLTDSSLRATFDQGITQEQLSAPGVYDVVIRCNGRTYASKLEVVDTVAPAAVAAAVTSNGELPAPEAFIAQISDATQVTVAYKTVPDVTVEGQQTVTLILTDAAGNTAELAAQLTVVTGTQQVPDAPDVSDTPDASDESTSSDGDFQRN